MRIRGRHELLPALSEAALRPGNFLIVLRITELGNIAWREGREEARALEARCVRVLDAMAQRTLRADDIIAHDAGTGDVCILLRARREAFRMPMPADARNVVGRIITALRSETALAIDYGWLDVHAGGTCELASLCEIALQRGKLEAERFAFFSAVGHELRTPLAAVRGSLEIVCDPETADATARRFAGIAYRETLRLGRLVEDLFTLSLDDDATVSEDGMTCAATAVQTAFAAQTASSHDAHVRLHAMLPDNLPAIAIPADRLVQILLILFDNAIKHGGTVSQIAVEGDYDGDGSVTLTISDDGIGIAPADRERIFFFGERGASRSAGTGIGLALARKFAERFEGSITCIESALGGAAFAVRFRSIA